MLRSTDRLIVHVDVDAFFASVEQLLVPSLRDRPVIVGSGCIASCSYEARASGLRAGMPLSQARRLCPRAVVLEGNYPIYRCFAEHVWEVFRRYATGLETFLDEAYGDATGMEAVHGSPLELGRSLQQAVRAEVGLPVSVGLASGRMMAKLASGSAKPYGVAWIRPGQEADFLAPLPVKKLPGVGGRTAERLHDLNIQTIAQMRRLTRQTLRCMFARRGDALYDRCRGIPDESALSRQAPPLPKTISRETTFHQPTSRNEELRGMLEYLTERAVRTARGKGLRAGTVELSIRYDDWKQDASAASLEAPTDRDDEVFALVLRLLDRLHKRRVALRHVGITLSNFTRDRGEPALFDLPVGSLPAGGRAGCGLRIAERGARNAERKKPTDLSVSVERQEFPERSAPPRDRSNLYRALDAIRDRWGHSAIVQGESVNLLGELKQNDYGFILRTPSLTK
ncbi:MAG: DNA polymerase IV [Planctomycetes bacterium ADurb.Bin126]|nr:MAG: DNA polymerase IV [Planctomycetes bacterium ADurb.Bin126]HOD80568.1 DNA polymerase IV [Phycisphaerae bacterium]HQL72409.1 DNA polymerase IV [Phycisphaerae bacterium]